MLADSLRFQKPTNAKPETATCSYPKRLIMFDFKYRIEFKNEDVTNLFGEEYYCDKSTFWSSHQTQLKALYNYVLSTEFPFKIIDLENATDLMINNQNEFDNWITTNQPFEIPKM